MEYIQQPVSVDDAQGRRRRRGLVALLLGLSLLTIGTGVFSLAVFTSTDTSSGSFTTATIVLDAAPATVFSVSGIVPGDSGSEDLTVTNAGTGTLRYAMTSSSTNADLKGLASALLLSIDEGTCAAPGANVYSGTLAAAAFGDPAQGQDGSDPELISGDSDEYCFSWSLPDTTGDGRQDATTTATFTFDAEQVANN